MQFVLHQFNSAESFVNPHLVCTCNLESKCAEQTLKFHTAFLSLSLDYVHLNNRT